MSLPRFRDHEPYVTDFHKAACRSMEQQDLYRGAVSSCSHCVEGPYAALYASGAIHDPIGPHLATLSNAHAVVQA